LEEKVKASASRKKLAAGKKGESQIWTRGGNHVGQHKDGNNVIRDVHPAGEGATEKSTILLLATSKVVKRVKKRGRGKMGGG